MRFFDRREEEMPALSKIRLRDLETGQSTEVDTSAKGFAEEYKRRAGERRKAWKKICDTAQVDSAEFSCHDDCAPLLSRFFASKLKRRKSRARGVA